MGVWAKGCGGGGGDGASSWPGSLCVAAIQWLNELYAGSCVEVGGGGLVRAS